MSPWPVKDWKFSGVSLAERMHPKRVIVSSPWLVQTLCLKYQLDIPISDIVNGLEVDA